MFRQKSRLTSLAAQKELLRMESQLNRAELLTAVQDIKNEFRQSLEQFSNVGSMMSIAGKVASFIPTITQFFSGRSPANPVRKRPSLLQGMLTGTSLWVLLRMLRRKA